MLQRNGACIQSHTETTQKTDDARQRSRHRRQRLQKSASIKLKSDERTTLITGQTEHLCQRKSTLIARCLGVHPNGRCDRQGTAKM